MYYIDRTDLGSRLASQISSFVVPEPIIVCLKESSLATAVSLASSLHGWIYPLVSETIQLDADNRVLGVISSDGSYTVNPALSRFEVEDIMMENHGVIEDKKRQAFSRLNQSASVYGHLNPEVFNDRLVILCADIIKDQLHIGAIKNIMKPYRPRSVIAAVGNIDVDAADLMRLTADQVRLMDVMSSMFDDGHYFEKTDPYPLETLQQIAMNISQFWKPLTPQQ